MNSKKFIYFVSGVLALLIFYLVFFTSNGFRITGFSPTLNNIATTTPYIDIYFSEPVSENDLSISSPNNIVSRYIIQSPKDVRVYITYPLNNNQKYEIVLDKIISFKGAVINFKTIPFTPLYTDPSSIPKSQIKYIVSKQDKSNSQIYGTTLVNILPYIAPGFTFMISYNMVNNNPAIVITSATSDGVSAAKTWITNQGYRVSSLNIIVINKQPV